MKLVEILNLANEGYEKRSGGTLSLRPFFDEKTGRPIQDAEGDGLAKFIVIEINDTFPESTTDEYQMEEAVHILQAGIDDLESARDAISAKLQKLQDQKKPQNSDETPPEVVVDSPKTKKFTVDYDVRHYNGSIEVEAEDEDWARDKVENMRIDKLLEHTNDVAVEVEKVSPTGSA